MMYQISVVAGVAVLLMMLSFMTATLQTFIWDCFQSGMVLRRYYVYLTLKHIRWRKKKDRAKRMLLKPAGLCPYCQAPYVSLPFFIGLMWVVGIGFWGGFTLFPLFLGVQNEFLKMMLKKKAI